MLNYSVLVYVNSLFCVLTGDGVVEADIDRLLCLPESSDAPLKKWKTTIVARPRVSRVHQMNKPQISLFCRAKAPPSLLPVFSSQHSGDRDILANSLCDSSEVTSARLRLMIYTCGPHPTSCSGWPVENLSMCQTSCLMSVDVRLCSCSVFSAVVQEECCSVLSPPAQAMCNATPLARARDGPSY